MVHRIVPEMHESTYQQKITNLSFYLFKKEGKQVT